MHTSFTKDKWQAFREMDRAGPLHMLNLIRLRQTAMGPDGKAVSGAEAYAVYSRISAPVFAGLGGRIIWRGAPEQVLIGPENEQWDICFIAEYPSVAAFAAMMRDPAYREAMTHRLAGVEDSRLIRLMPQAGGTGFGG